MDQYECKAECRMWRNDVYTLLETVNLPEELRCYNGAVVDSAEALCILLRRVAYRVDMVIWCRDLHGLFLSYQ